MVWSFLVSATIDKFLRLVIGEAAGKLAVVNKFEATEGIEVSLATAVLSLDIYYE